ncbi:hypothetical protein SAMN05660653_01336 [Desulfonatronum thiosulfatophilum]|uniref:Uncharacterized protein n=1 Tax=Desulfonatronum thiosulfatophilum TaxID=617002 RepID=A0A1G6C5V2_9BACT|nr:hypothetical protein SAMN05660653_01336 [Desulfonatronum thiosulfatophilum]
MTRGARIIVIIKCNLAEPAQKASMSVRKMGRYFTLFCEFLQKGKAMRKLFSSAFLGLALSILACSSSHANSGTYIDCIHGCPILIICSNCCNETFSDVLTKCNANQNRCEALCPPNTSKCLNPNVFGIETCLQQASKNLKCPQWKSVARPQAVLTRSAASECRFCYEDDR